MHKSMNIHPASGYDRNMFCSNVRSTCSFTWLNLFESMNRWFSSSSSMMKCSCESSAHTISFTASSLDINRRVLNIKTQKGKRYHWIKDPLTTTTISKPPVGMNGHKSFIKNLVKNY